MQLSTRMLVLQWLLGRIGVSSQTALNLTNSRCFFLSGFRLFEGKVGGAFEMVDMDILGYRLIQTLSGNLLC